MVSAGGKLSVPGEVVSASASASGEGNGECGGIAELGGWMGGWEDGAGGSATVIDAGSVAVGSVGDLGGGAGGRGNAISPGSGGASYLRRQYRFA